MRLKNPKGGNAFWLILIAEMSKTSVRIFGARAPRWIVLLFITKEMSGKRRCGLFVS